MADITPFKGRTLSLTPAMRTIHRLTKPGHVAEIRERTITAFAALEWMVFIDGGLTESRMYHGDRAQHYATELAERVAVMQAEDGWRLEPLPLPVDQH